jgi:aminopeptidase N
VDRVIAHEYFHNWTGNRVTCRDWFQLSLKEGLTVYRDQEYGADEYSRPVVRIQEVRGLRETQYPEDAGPMAHSVRPDSYVEVNNFYTSTVYDKGAEVVRMYATLLGKAGFRRGMDLYFQRHDGQAVTCDDFRNAMADANGVDLAQFDRWYSQAGTPRSRGARRSRSRRAHLHAAPAADLPAHARPTGQGALCDPVRGGSCQRRRRGPPAQRAPRGSAAARRVRDQRLEDRNPALLATRADLRLHGHR